MTASSIILRWQEGTDNGRKVLGYIVEGLSNYDLIWEDRKTSNIFKYILP